MRLKQTFSDQFSRDVVKLVTRRGAGQAISFAVIPILTRLYSPAQFGVFTVYFSILSILSVVSSLRMDLALAIPRTQRLTFNVLALGLIASLVFALIGLLCVLLFWLCGISFTPRWAVWPYLAILPFASFVVGAGTLISNYALRAQAFPVIARSRVAQALAGALAQLLFGWFRLGGHVG